MTNETVLSEIGSVLAEYEAVERQYERSFQGNTYIDAPDVIARKLLTLLRAAIDRLSPNATYVRLADDVKIEPHPNHAVRQLAGILQGLRADYAANRIKTFQELVHSDLFADMLEAAEYLLSQTYKDPAAVMAGGILEQHLRELCRKHGIDTTFTTPGGDTKPKMIDGMNSDLAKASAYGKIEQKQVTAWAGIRNAAAHGKYGEYDENQVRQMITGMRDFIAKYPA